MSPLYVQAKPRFDLAVAHYAREAQTATLSVRSAALSTSGGAVRSGQQSVVHWGDILARLVGTLAQIAKTLTGDDAEKKTAVMAAVKDFYEQAVRPELSGLVNRPVIFGWFEPSVEQAFLSAAEGLYDGIVKILNPAPADAADPAATAGFIPY
jgi:hypothetical protein